MKLDKDVYSKFVAIVSFNQKYRDMLETYEAPVSQEVFDKFTVYSFNPKTFKGLHPILKPSAYIFQLNNKVFQRVGTSKTDGVYTYNNFVADGNWISTKLSDGTEMRLISFDYNDSDTRYIWDLHILGFE